MGIFRTALLLFSAAAWACPPQDLGYLAPHPSPVAADLALAASRGAPSDGLRDIYFKSDQWSAYVHGLYREPPREIPDNFTFGDINGGRVKGKIPYDGRHRQLPRQRATHAHLAAAPRV